MTPPARRTFEAVADELPAPASLAVRALLWPPATDRVLDLLGEDVRRFDSLLHNTANATVIRGGEKENVVPERVDLTLDVRLLPGFGPADGIAELRDVVGDDPEVEVLRYGEGPPAADMGLFDHLAGVLDEAGDGRPVPLLLSGRTDARHFADLGIQSYGFTPMPLPEGFDFTDYVHATDERIPVEAVEFGADTVTEAVRGYGPGAIDG